MFTMFAEVKQDGEWCKVGKEFKSTYDELDGQLTDRVYDGRCSDLIQFLCSRCCRGEPEYLSADIDGHKLFQDDEFVYHATLRELLELDWDSEIYEIGYISEWQYKRLIQDGVKPIRIMKDVFSKGNMIVTPFLMDVILENPSLRQDVRYFVKHKYNNCKIRYLSEFFFNESIPGLIKLIPEGGSTNDVRIVFSII